LNPRTRLLLALVFFLPGCGSSGCLQMHIVSISPGLFPLQLQPGMQVTAHASLHCDDCFLPILSRTCDCSSWAYRRLSWTSSDPEVVTVVGGVKLAGAGDRSLARLTGMREGKAVLRLKAGTAKAQQEVQVVTFRSLQFETNEVHLLSGQLTWLMLSATSATGERLQFPMVESWTSSDPDVLRIEIPNGASLGTNMFKALNLGESLVTATAGALSATAHVTVGIDHPIHIFGPDQLSIGEKSELRAWTQEKDGGYPEVANLAPDYPGRVALAGPRVLRWSVTGESVTLSPRPDINGEVDSGGIRIEAKRAGNSAVTATTIDGRTATHDVLVQ
jgi:hypothetical protein